MTVPAVGLKLHRTASVTSRRNHKCLKVADFDFHIAAAVVVITLHSSKEWSQLVWWWTWQMRWNMCAFSTSFNCTTTTHLKRPFLHRASLLLDCNAHLELSSSTPTLSSVCERLIMDVGNKPLLQMQLHTLKNQLVLLNLNHPNAANSFILSKC